MIAGFDANEFLGLGEGADERLEFSGRRKLIARPADKKLGLQTGAQEFKIVDAGLPRFGRYGHGRQAEGDQRPHPIIVVGRSQADGGPEGKSGKDQWKRKFALEPVKRYPDILNFTNAMRVLTLAESGAAKVEAQHRKSEAVESFHGVEDDFVVKSAAIKRVRMAYERCVCRRRRARIEQRFQTPSVAFKK